MAQRSTKGASKQRRDAINDRISQIRELLPVSDAVRNRLSQLQVMALTNAFIAKSNFFSDYSFDIDDRSSTYAQLFDFSQSLPGFLMIASVDGRILYISDSVSDYLGNSAVDSVTQIESIYDIIDERDRDVISRAMAQHQKPPTEGGDAWMQNIDGLLAPRPVDSSASELSFTCRMNGAFKGVRNQSMYTPCLKTGFEKQRTMHVSGRFLQPRSTLYGNHASPYSQRRVTVFVAHCTPHISATSNASSFDYSEHDDVNTMTFQSTHGLDMKFTHIESNGEQHLGYNHRMMLGKSWYAMIHPEDIAEAQRKHIELTSSYHLGNMTSSKSVCVRVQTANGQFVWLHVVMRIHSNEECSSRSNYQQVFIVCTNEVIDEVAALFLRVRDVEIEAAAIDSENLQLAFCSSDNGVQHPVFETSSRRNVIPAQTSSMWDADKPDVHYQLKRKIIERQFEQLASCTPKLPRLDNVQPDDITMKAVCSMPSPPLQLWDSITCDSLAAQMPPSVFNFGAVPDKCVRASEVVDDVHTSTHVGQISVPPNSILTPSNSPAHTVQEDPLSMGFFDLEDLMRRLPDDCSFFNGNESNITTATNAGENKVAVDSNLDSGCWSSFVGNLPELDHRSVASILGEFELPTNETSEFKSESRRQQMSGGRIIHDGSKLDEFDQSSKTGHSQQHQHLAIPTRMLEEHSGRCADALGNQHLNEQLINNLLELGGNFLQDLQLGIPDTSRSVEYYANKFRPASSDYRHGNAFHDIQLKTRNSTFGSLSNLTAFYNY